MYRVSGHYRLVYLDTYGRMHLTGVFMAPAQQDGFDNTRNERTLEGGGSGAA